MRGFIQYARENLRRVAAGILVALFFAVGGFLFLALTSGSDRPSDVRFVAARYGVWHLAQELHKAELVSSAILFRLGVFLIPGRGLRGGEYLIRRDDSIADIIAAMRRGKSFRHKLTIPEGLTNYQINEILRINSLLIGHSGVLPEEGVLLPETYFIYRDQKRANVIKRMHRAHNRLMKELWAERDSSLPLRDMHQAVVLASIVEKETGLSEERAHIAGVFINRLSRDSYMPLQSDPTVIYALTQGKPLDRLLTYSDLKLDHPYNTYRNLGLPPGAIANPGRAAIEAVLNPAETKDLFFVADGTGGHIFAVTYDEHKKNVAKWREIQKSKPPARDQETAMDSEPPIQ